MEDIVRVLRVLEYVGERSEVETQILKSLLDGTKIVNKHLTINVATVGTFPEALTKAEES